MPDLAAELVADQRRALAMQERAATIAQEEGAQAIGLGNALAVVAGRGAELAQRTSLTVTTGQASTAWACVEIAKLAMRRHSTEADPIGVLGFKGTVGDAVAACLANEGYKVVVAGSGKPVKRRAEELGCVHASLEEMLNVSTTLIGASTTGPTLRPEQLNHTRVLIDLALPPTLHRGRRPKGLRVYAGEPLLLPGPIQPGFWGRIWLLMAGYGRNCIYACLAEPLAISLTHSTPWSQGRRLSQQGVQSAGKTLTQLGFEPVLRRR